MTKKQQLEYLLEAYKRNEYDIKTFCDEFTRIFYQAENDNDVIDDDKFKILSQLAAQCERYTPYEEDLVLSEYFVDDKYMNDQILKGYCEYFK